jgi:hypothetical protein
MFRQDMQRNFSVYLVYEKNGESVVQGGSILAPMRTEKVTEGLAMSQPLDVKMRRVMHVTCLNRQSGSHPEGAFRTA